MKRAFAFLIIFCLIFEQTGFAQVAAPLGVPAYLNNSAPVADRFRPVHLRSLSFDQAQNSFDLLLDRGDTKDLQKPQAESTAKTLLEYFQIGLRLPNDAFWVNLRPDAPADVIDPALEKTDIGKVMLAADLQLKKDMARLTSPDTAEGKEYWDSLYAKAESLYGPVNMSIPSLTRPWIVPGEIIIQETKDGAYILKATLKVMLEEDYLAGSAKYSFEDGRAKALNDYSSQLLRKLVIPRLTVEVNASRKYADLRQVYYSLILAQWFKGKAGSRGARVESGSPFSKIDSSDLTGLTSKAAWSKSTYFDAYKRSFVDGEYSREENVYGAYGMTARRYFSGGMVLNAAKEIQGLLLTGSKPLSNSIGSAVEHVVIRSDGTPAPDRQDGGNSHDLESIWTHLYSNEKQSLRELVQGINAGEIRNMKNGLVITVNTLDYRERLVGQKKIRLDFDFHQDAVKLTQYGDDGATIKNEKTSALKYTKGLANVRLDNVFIPGDLAGEEVNLQTVIARLFGVDPLVFKNFDVEVGFYVVFDSQTGSYRFLVDESIENNFQIQVFPNGKVRDFAAAVRQTARPALKVHESIVAEGHFHPAGDEVLSLGDMAAIIKRTKDSGVMTPEIIATIKEDPLLAKDIEASASGFPQRKRHMVLMHYSLEDLPGAVAAVNDLFKQYGPDVYAEQMVEVIPRYFSRQAIGQGLSGKNDGGASQDRTGELRNELNRLNRELERIKQQPSTFRDNSRYLRQQRILERIAEIEAEIAKREPAAIPRINIEGYMQLPESEKKRLLEEFFKRFKVAPLVLSTGQSLNLSNALADEARLAQLSEAARQMNSLDAKYPNARRVSLGRTPLWFLDAARLLNGERGTYIYAAFSGSWYYRGTRALPGPNRDQIKAYREYLHAIGLSPEEIISRANAGEKTILIEFVDSGSGLSSFLSILDDWARESNLVEPLKKSLIIHLLQHPKPAPLKTFDGFEAIQQEIGDDLLWHLDEEGSLGVSYPYEKWQEKKIRETYPISDITDDAALIRFRIIDFLAGKGLLQQGGAAQDGGRAVTLEQAFATMRANVLTANRLQRAAGESRDRPQTVLDLTNPEVLNEMKRLEEWQRKLVPGTADGGSAQKKTGGIDLRSLPIATRPVSEAGLAEGALAPDKAVIEQLNSQWQEIQGQMQGPQMPYAKMKEYVVTCKKENAGQQLDAVLACIANILRIEEERAMPTAPELKEILVSIG